MTERMSDERLAFLDSCGRISGTFESELLAALKAERQQCEELQARVTELEAIISDLPCNDPCCGMCEHVCDNCRKRNIAFGGANE